MDQFIQYTFRFVLYSFFGLTMEMIFSIDGIDRALGYAVHRRVPKKYGEGFVSLYMIPLHGLGLLFGFEFVHAHTKSWFVLYRFCVWAIMITLCEIAWGAILDRILGFYTWDYYAESKYKIFKRGYSLWTLVPLWGIAGLILEFYSQLLLYLSPYALIFIHQFFG